MKNIHLLPTDKPSRLHWYGDGFFGLSKVYLPWKEGKNIYITSDEEIKESDSYLDITDNTIWRNEADESMSKTLFPECKKIILTTDQDLIKDGVQAIDDEFLEWFVKNPSCEGVEVADLWKDGNPSTHFSYQIIIPQEEPCSFCKGTGQIVSCTKISGYKTCDCINILQEEPKQETLEEAAERLYPENIESIMDGYHDSNSYQREAFIKGAKWQQERSEEEIIWALLLCSNKKFKNSLEVKEWWNNFNSK